MVEKKNNYYYIVDGHTMKELHEFPSFAKLLAWVAKHYKLVSHNWFIYNNKGYIANINGVIAGLSESKIKKLGVKETRKLDKDFYNKF